MPTFIESLGQQAAGGAVGSIMGLALEKHNDKRQLRQEGKLMQMQGQQAREMAMFNHEQQMKMWRDTNYSAQMAELSKAGLNPGLIYGMGGGSGGTTAAAQAAPGRGGAPSGGGEAQAMGIMGIQAALLAAQTRKTNAEAENLETTKPNIPLQGENIKADTENKVLNGIIAKYAGKEAADQYQIKSENRAIEADMYQKEMEARIGVAGTIYELWVDGKLKEKSLNEIEAVALGNAKSREEKVKIMKEVDLLEANLKGQNIANAIGELEMQIQKNTGVDKASPAWMKVLARLYVGLIGK